MVSSVVIKDTKVMKAMKDIGKVRTVEAVMVAVWIAILIITFLAGTFGT